MTISKILMNVWSKTTYSFASPTKFVLIELTHHYSVSSTVLLTFLKCTFDLRTPMDLQIPIIISSSFLFYCSKNKLPCFVSVPLSLSFYRRNRPLNHFLLVPFISFIISFLTAIQSV